jgi:hypothetical protein
MFQGNLWAVPRLKRVVRKLPPRRPPPLICVAMQSIYNKLEAGRETFLAAIAQRVHVFHMRVTALPIKTGRFPLPQCHPHPLTIGSLRRKPKTLLAGSTKSNAHSFYLLSFFAITFPLIQVS